MYGGEPSTSSSINDEDLIKHNVQHPNNETGRQEEGMGGTAKTANEARKEQTLFAVPKIPHERTRKVDNYDMKALIRDFWPRQKRKMQMVTLKELREASRSQVLPLARVKKIMKIEENVQKQMIAADAPLVLSVACEMLIEEMTLRSWEVTEEGKRKTLQKSDISVATSRHEHMDFLIDIVPRTGIANRETNSAIASNALSASQIVQVVRSTDGGEAQAKAATIQSFSGDGSGVQGEFTMRLENGEVVQATPIGNPIQLNPQTVSQLGMGKGVKVDKASRDPAPHRALKTITAPTKIIS